MAEHKIDPLLRGRLGDRTRNQAEAERDFSAAGPDSAAPVLQSVFVRFEGDSRELERGGLHIDTLLGGIAIGRIALEDVRRLAEAVEVKQIQAARPVKAMPPIARCLTFTDTCSTEQDWNATCSPSWICAPPR